MKNGFRIRDLFPFSKKKIEIKVETRKTLQIRRLKKSVLQYCPVCRNKSLFVSGKEALILIGGNTEAMGILLETGKVHFTDSPENESLICINSLKLEIEVEEDSE